MSKKHDAAAQDSSHAGFLPLSPAPAFAALEDALHDTIAGITGLAGHMVRPRWQAQGVKAPAPGVSWCAFGVTQRRALASPSIEHCPKNGGRDVIITHEVVDVLTSFYGHGGHETAMSLRDGIMVAQNRAALREAGLAFTRAESCTHLPEMVGMQWRARTDLPLVFMYETRRSYAACNVARAAGFLRADRPITVPTGCEACRHKCYEKIPF